MTCMEVETDVVDLVSGFVSLFASAGRIIEAGSSILDKFY